MLEVSFTPHFARILKKLPKNLQEEIFDKVDLFCDTKNHSILKVHKLRGRLSGVYSFSVNYRYRIIFEYLNKNKVVLLAVGDHSVYE